MTRRELQHGFRDGHLEIHACLGGAQQQLHVARLDVPSVLAQMHGDAVGPRLLGDQRGRDRIRITGAARLTHGRNVIDVDAEMNG